MSRWHRHRCTLRTTSTIRWLVRTTCWWRNWKGKQARTMCLNKSHKTKRKMLPVKVCCPCNWHPLSLTKPLLRPSWTKPCLVPSQNPVRRISLNLMEKPILSPKSILNKWKKFTKNDKNPLPIQDSETNCKLKKPTLARVEAISTTPITTNQQPSEPLRASHLLAMSRILQTYHWTYQPQRPRTIRHSTCLTDSRKTNRIGKSASTRHQAWSFRLMIQESKRFYQMFKDKVTISQFKWESITTIKSSSSWWVTKLTMQQYKQTRILWINQKCLTLSTTTNH